MCKSEILISKSETNSKFQMFKVQKGFGHFDFGYSCVFRISYFGLRISKVKRGFTLVELLLYMGIFVILLSVFIQLFSSLVSTQLNSESSSSVSQGEKYILARMSYDLSRSQNIISPSQGISSSTLQFIVSGQQYTYGLSGNNITLTNTSGTDQLNNSDTTISNLSFTPIGSSSGKYTVKVNFTITSVGVSNGKNETQSIQTTVGKR